MSSHFLFGFCKFRTLNHKLPIECRRWQNIARNMRFCNLCNQNKIGEEYRYILECKFFNSVRKEYIDAYFRKRPSTAALKFGQLMKTKNKIKPIFFCRFIKVINKAVCARANLIATF